MPWECNWDYGIVSSACLLHSRFPGVLRQASPVTSSSRRYSVVPATSPSGPRAARNARESATTTITAAAAAGAASSSAGELLAGQYPRRPCGLGAGRKRSTPARPAPAPARISDDTAKEPSPSRPFELWGWLVPGEQRGRGWKQGGRCGRGVWVCVCGGGGREGAMMNDDVLSTYC